MLSVRIFDTISDSAIVFVKNKVLECIYPTRDLMISNPIRRYGAAILMLLTCVFSGSVLATTHTATKSHKAPTVKKISSTKVSSKQEYSRNSVKSSSLPDLRKYPSGTPRKKRFSGRSCLILPSRIRRLLRIVTGLFPSSTMLAGRRAKRRA